MAANNTATITIQMGPPALTTEANMKYLAKNPAVSGIPARDKKETNNDMATKGCLRANPLNDSIESSLNLASTAKIAIVARLYAAK